MYDRLLVRIAKNLEKAKIPYMVMGGLAILQYGEFRATKDIDITLGLGIDGFSQVLQFIEDCRLKSLVRSPKEFVQQTYVLPVEDKKTGIRVDLILSNTLFEHQAIKRATRIKIGYQIVRFASVEDLVIQKIIAGRPRDLEDVSKMLMKNVKLNVRYVKQWLGKFEQTLDMSFVNRFVRILEGK